MSVGGASRPVQRRVDLRFLAALQELDSGQMKVLVTR